MCSVFFFDSQRDCQAHVLYIVFHRVSRLAPQKGKHPVFFLVFFFFFVLSISFSQRHFFVSMFAAKDVYKLSLQSLNGVSD